MVQISKVRKMQAGSFQNTSFDGPSAQMRLFNSGYLQLRYDTCILYINMTLYRSLRLGKEEEKLLRQACCTALKE